MNNFIMIDGEKILLDRVFKGNKKIRNSARKNFINSFKWFDLDDESMDACYAEIGSFEYKENKYSVSSWKDFFESFFNVLEKEYAELNVFDYLIDNGFSSSIFKNEDKVNDKNRRVIIRRNNKEKVYVYCLYNNDNKINFLRRLFEVLAEDMESLKLFVR